MILDKIFWKKDPFSGIFMLHNLIQNDRRHSNKYLNTYWKFGYNYLVMIHFLLYDYKINVYVKNSNIKYIFRIINKRSEIQIKSVIN